MGAVSPCSSGADLPEGATDSVDPDEASIALGDDVVPAISFASELIGDELASGLSTGLETSPSFAQAALRWAGMAMALTAATNATLRIERTLLMMRTSHQGSFRRPIHD